MNLHINKIQQSKSQSNTDINNTKKEGNNSGFTFIDNRPGAIVQKKLLNIIDTSTQVQQLKASQVLGTNCQPIQMMQEKGVIQMMRPEQEGWYKIKGDRKLWYKGEPEQEGRYNFYGNRDKKMSQKILEADIIEKIVEEEKPVDDSGVTPLPNVHKAVNIASAQPEIRLIEKDNNETPDQLISGKYDEEPGDFDANYVRKIKVGNKYHERIQALILKAKEFLHHQPEGYIGLWRFHMNEEEYQSHAYRKASQKQEVVPKEVLETAISDLQALSSHMYESSKKSNSPGVSFTRSIDSLIDASFHTGADSVLRAVIFGNEKIEAAKFLSFIALPKARLILPENVSVPPDVDFNSRDRKAEARSRSLKELEALYIPTPESGGKTPAPLFTVHNPFPKSNQSGFKQLEKLDLSGVDIHWTATKTLLVAIEKGQLPKLKKLIIKASAITPDLRGEIMRHGVTVDVLQ